MFDFQTFFYIFKVKQKSKPPKSETCSLYEKAGKRLQEIKINLIILYPNLAVPFGKFWARVGCFRAAVCSRERRNIQM